MSESIQLYLNSKYADTKPNGDAGDCIYYFPVIEIPDGHYIYLSLQNAVIPYSFYAINANDNILYYGIVGGSTNYLVVPPGNYNINQLITSLKTLMGVAYNITYNSIINKITITNTTNDFIIYGNGSLNRTIGFSTISNTYSNSKTLNSTNCINMNQIRAINLEVNLPTYNINIAQKQNQNILATIPVTVPPYSLIDYINQNNFRVNMYIGKLDQLQIRLFDNNNNLLNLNGLDYQLTLQIDIVNFTD
jgi:hypothetical protein